MRQAADSSPVTTSSKQNTTQTASLLEDTATSGSNIPSTHLWSFHAPVACGCCQCEEMCWDITQWFLSALASIIAGLWSILGQEELITSRTARQMVAVKFESWNGSGGLYPGTEYVHVRLVHNSHPHGAEQRYRNVVEVYAVCLCATALDK